MVESKPLFGSIHIVIAFIEPYVLLLVAMKLMVELHILFLINVFFFVIRFQIRKSAKSNCLVTTTNSMKKNHLYYMYKISETKKKKDRVTKSCYTTIKVCAKCEHLTFSRYFPTTKLLRHFWL